MKIKRKKTKEKKKELSTWHLISIKTEQLRGKWRQTEANEKIP